MFKLSLAIILFLKGLVNRNQIFTFFHFQSSAEVLVGGVGYGFVILLISEYGGQTIPGVWHKLPTGESTRIQFNGTNIKSRYSINEVHVALVNCSYHNVHILLSYNPTVYLSLIYYGHFHSFFQPMQTEGKFLSILRTYK